MEAFFEKVAKINGSVNGVVWGIFGLALLIGTGVIVTLSTKAFQPPGRSARISHSDSG